MPGCRDSRTNSVAPLGRAIRDLRHALRWRQADLAAHATVTQGWVSKIERGRAEDVSLRAVAHLLDAMGARIEWRIDAPYLADRRPQRDAGHSRCVAYVVGRLSRAGWHVSTEVEVGGDRSRGWLDILAKHPRSGVLLVIEVKTELHDLGAIVRTLGWYERESWTAARRLGWRPRLAVGALLVLETAAVDERIRANAPLLRLEFPGRSRDLGAIVAGAMPKARDRHVALIDPRSRRAEWLQPLRLDGRRTPAPYRDYADFVGTRSRQGKETRPRDAGRTTAA